MLFIITHATVMVSRMCKGPRHTSSWRFRLIRLPNLYPPKILEYSNAVGIMRVVTVLVWHSYGFFT